MKYKLNTYKIILILLILANFLELFVPRMDTGNYFVRLPIQIIDGLVLIIMWVFLLIHKIHWNRISISIVSIMLLILFYSFLYYLGGTFSLQGFAPYLRFLLWITSIIFFFEQFILHGINRLLFKILICVFLLIVFKDIINTFSVRDLDTTGGDTAALPLLFSIPFIMYFFNKKFKFILIGLIILMIMYSLRRTAILGMILCLPFFYNDIKSKLKFTHVILILLILATVIIYAWEQVGSVLSQRFNELLVGDGGGDKDSFGSGRSIFYAIVWNHWIGGSSWQFFTGYGLHSVYTLLMKTYGIAHTHNDFLEIAHTFGILGLLMWFFFLKNIWALRKKIKRGSRHMLNIYYMSFISYFVIALASGCILRLTTLPFAMCIAILLYESTVGNKYITSTNQIKYKNNSLKRK